MENNLLPCPFCGGKVGLYYNHVLNSVYIAHLDESEQEEGWYEDDCCFEETALYDMTGEKKLIATWNDRIGL